MLNTDTLSSAATNATGSCTWCQCDTCAASQRASPSFARLSAPTIPRGSVTVITDADMGFVCNDKLVVTKVAQEQAAAGVKLGMQLSAFHGAGAHQHWVLSEKEMKEYTATKNDTRKQASTAASNWRALVATCEAAPRPWTFTFSPCSGDQTAESDSNQSSRARVKARRKSRLQRRPVVETGDSTSQAQTPPLEQDPYELSELQLTAATLGTAAGVSTFVARCNDAEFKTPLAASQDDDQSLPWTQRKRIAVERLQQQLSEAKKVLAQHKGFGRMIGILEAERNQVNQPQFGQDGGRQENDGTADDAPGIASLASTAFQDANLGIPVDLSALQSEMENNDEQQRINDAVQEELAQ
eukprot:COSAG03_NODE_6407_length_1065_cov_0.990683_1_plen_354_part_11